MELLPAELVLYICHFLSIRDIVALRGVCSYTRACIYENYVEKNIEAASKWPPTYAEFSKGGAGIHLHYIYNGDINKLSRIYADNIEIKL